MDSRMLEAKMVLRDISVSEICDKLGMNRSTWWRKINQYVDFTRNEISIIARVLSLTDDEILHIFFPERCQ